MDQNRTASRRKKIRLYTALVLFLGMVLALLITATGIPLHEWVGILIVVPLLIHIIVDWKWIVNVTLRFFKKQPGQTRFNYCWDWLFFILMTVAMFSGLAVSETALPAVGITPEVDLFWTVIHILSSRLLMVVMGVHIAMHLKWIIGALKRSAIGVPTPDLNDKRRVEKGILQIIKKAAYPILGIFLAAASISLILLPMADTDWSAIIRPDSNEPLGFGGEHPEALSTIITDLIWILIPIGVSALVTLGILGLIRFFSTIVKWRTVKIKRQ